MLSIEDLERLGARRRQLIAIIAEWIQSADGRETQEAWSTDEAERLVRNWSASSGGRKPAKIADAVLEVQSIDRLLSSRAK